MDKREGLADFMRYERWYKFGYEKYENMKI